MPGLLQATGWRDAKAVREEAIMHGKPSVVARLNQLVTGELSAADQYLIHAELLRNWGFHALAERVRQERAEELEHADRLVRRVLLLDGVPDVSVRAPITVGGDVPQILRNDLALELAVINALRDSIALCEQEQDYETRHILRELLADSEQHGHWLEQQLFLIDRIGLANYLQSAMGGIGGED
jgi:bacterioferritin